MYSLCFICLLTASCFQPSACNAFLSFSHPTASMLHTSHTTQLLALGPKLPFFFIISASSSSISLSIFAPLLGSFPCIFAGAVGSSFASLASSLSGSGSLSFLDWAASLFAIERSSSVQYYISLCDADARVGRGFGLTGIILVVALGLALGVAVGCDFAVFVVALVVLWIVVSPLVGFLR